jgi:hypothetical protein
MKIENPKKKKLFRMDLPKEISPSERKAWDKYIGILHVEDNEIGRWAISYSGRFMNGSPQYLFKCRYTPERAKEIGMLYFTSRLEKDKYLEWMLRNSRTGYVGQGKGGDSRGPSNIEYLYTFYTPYKQCIDRITEVVEKARKLISFSHDKEDISPLFLFFPDLPLELIQSISKFFRKCEMTELKNTWKKK